MRRRVRPVWVSWTWSLMAIFIFWSEGFGQTNGVAPTLGLGKLGVRSQAIGQSLRMTLPYLVPGDITRGWGAYLGNTWTNVWANDEEFLLDYEMLDTFLGVGYGLGEHLGMALMLDHREYFGGAMDGFIQGFHDLFAISQDGRDTASNGHSIIRLYDPATGEQTATVSARDMNNTGLSLLLNYTFDFGDHGLPAVNVYGAARYALQPARVFEQSDRLDYGLGLGLAKRWFCNWYTYGAVGYTFYASQVLPDQVAFADRQATALFALAWQYRPGLAFMAQYFYSDAGIKTLQALDKPSHEVHLGFKWRFRPNCTMDFALIENIITLDNSPDFGVHLGWGMGF